MCSPSGSQACQTLPAISSPSRSFQRVLTNLPDTAGFPHDHWPWHNVSKHCQVLSSTSFRLQRERENYAAYNHSLLGCSAYRFTHPLGTDLASTMRLEERHDYHTPQNSCHMQDLMNCTYLTKPYVCQQITHPVMNMSYPTMQLSSTRYCNPVDHALPTTHMLAPCLHKQDAAH